jgi:hypothetical protein
MKKCRNRVFKLLVINTLMVFSCFSQIVEKRCATGEFEKIKCVHDKKYAVRRLQFNQKISQQILAQQRPNAKKSGIQELLRIPVVVHVIHNDITNKIGGSSNANISAEQITSQIEVLNEDYRRKANTFGFNTNPIGVDMNIEFYLADIDPNGKPTTGINRVYSERKSYDPFSEDDQRAMSALSYWPSDSYLNIWTTTLANNYLGYAQFPTAPDFEGLLEDEQDANIDGVYIDYKFFGRKASTITSRVYKYGRTTTHEVGHWLGLIHIWGDEDCGDDYVADTPRAQNSNLTLFCNEKFSTCNGPRTRNMIENYMDYTIDSCMNIFTIGQRERVEKVFEISPRRKKLKESTIRLPESTNLALDVFPNPAIDVVKGNVLFTGRSDAEIQVFDPKGNMIDKQFFVNKRSFSFSIDATTWIKQTYLLKVITQDQTVIKRIVVE